MPTSDIFYVKKRKDNPKENLEKKPENLGFVWGFLGRGVWKLKII